MRCSPAGSSTPPPSSGRSSSELAQVLAQPYSTADFRHGPVALVEPGFPVLAIATAGELEDDVDELIQSVAKHGPKCWYSTTAPTARFPGRSSAGTRGSRVAGTDPHHRRRPTRRLPPHPCPWSRPRCPRGLRKVTRTV